MYARTTKTGSQQAYDSIVSLTNIYNKIISNAKWDGIMDFKPRDLAVFQPPASFEDNFSRKEKSNPLENKQLIVIKTTDFESKANNPARIINGLGHSGKAVEIAKGKENALKYKIFTTSAGNVVLYTCLLPNHPLNSGDIRFAVAIDDEEPQIVSIKTKFRSEEWKQNVLRNQSIRTTHHNIKTAGEHAVTIYALDEGIVLDQLNLIKI